MLRKHLRNVRHVCPYITPNSHVLEIGCGWEIPPQMLITERNRFVI